MNKIDLLILNGSPGSGKSTLANVISEQLRENSIKHAVIDLDKLAIVYPESIDSLNKLKWKNLAAVWPNYVELGNLKVIISVLIDRPTDLEALKKAVPANTFTVCHLTAPLDILKARVTEREPNEYWKGRLQGLVDKYHQRTVDDKFGDFEIDTSKKSVTDTAREIMSRVGWTPVTSSNNN